ncbi:MAG: autotransporter domain-containing protein, partial [Akkermansiaceae bacterium]|nr:autotransporter domain-containing protein [Akkermansiaceae bacterium]
ETASGANLGSGQLNSGPGEVTLGGNSAAEDVNVDSGNLNLNGELTGVTDLAVASGASLTLGAAERINNAAVLHNNDGTVTLNGAEEAKTFNSTGLLDGTGTLTAEDYNLSNGATTAVGADLGGGQIISGPGIVTLNGNAAAEDVDVNSGTMNLNGELTGVTDLSVSSGAALVLGGAERINNGAVLNNNGGNVSLSGAEEIAEFNSTGTLDGPGTLTAANYNLSNGAITAVGANLGSGHLSSGPGVVTLNGDAAAEDVDVNSGEFNLNGSLTGATDVTVSDGAILRSASADRVNDAATVNLNGGSNWILGGDETVTSFVSSGLLNGGGLLTADQYDLSNGAVTAVGSNLGTGVLNSGPGAVVLNGDTNADILNVNSGTLTTEGAVQNSGGVITVGSGATWFVNNSYVYDSLQGAGTVDPGGVNGNTFTNSTNLRPGTSIGSISVVGDYVESGTYHGELDPTSLGGAYLLSDNLTVSGGTTLSASSVFSPSTINGLTADGVLIGHRFDIISSAGGIAGGWSEITDGNNAGPGGSTSESQFFFNTATGDLLALGLTGSQTPSDYSGITSNQVTILNSITDGATDAVGNYSSTDGAEGTVLDAIYANGAPGDVGGRLSALNALSPEGYAGALDYTLHATRVYADRVRTAVPLVGTSKYAIVAGLNFFGLGSSSSDDSNDYDINSSGGYVGVRTRGNDEFTFGGYLAFDSGDIDAGRADIDADGFVFGGFVEYTPRNAKALSYWGSMSYGSYEFDGDRQGLVSRLSTSSFDGSAFQAGFGVDYLSYEKNGFRIVPSGSLNFISSSVDGFSESGGPDALIVDDMDADAMYLELALNLQYKLPKAPAYLYGELGWQHNFGDVDHDVSATLGGSRFEVNAPGLGSDAVILGLGIQYDVSKQYQIDLSYRGEFRGDADAYSGLNLGIKGSF